MQTAHRRAAESELVITELRAEFRAELTALAEKVVGVGGVEPRLAAVEDAVSLLALGDNTTQCGAYPEVPGGGLVRGGGLAVGSIRIIDCSAGTVLAGSSGVVVCHTDGEWSDSLGTVCRATSTTTTATTT